MKMLVVVVLVLAAVAAYAYLNPEQAWRAVRMLPDRVVESLPVEPERTVLYRWEDAEGRVHVTDRPPAAGTPYERLGYDRDLNVVEPGVQVDEEKE